MIRLVILIAWTMVVSALTAYYADIWGRKLGKQRKTLFGWRPKRTAVVIITVSGALISAVSIGVLLTADRGIRTALLHWDRTVRELKHARADVERQRAALDSSRLEIEAIEKRLEQNRAALELADAKMKAVQTQLMDKQADLKRMQGDLTQTRASLRIAAVQVQRTHAELNQAKGDLAKTRAAVARSKALLAKNQRILANASRVAIDMTIKQLAAERSAAQAAQGLYAVRRDEEILRQVIPPRSTMAQAREDAARALNDARVIIAKRAKDHGVAFAPGAGYVKLLPKTVRTLIGGKPVNRVVPENKVLDAVAAQLMSPNSPSPGGVVLQVIAARNALAGETALVDFRLFENHVVFEKGTELARVMLSSHDTKAEVMDGLTNALMQVRTSALKNGLMPSSDDSVGSLPAYQLPDVYSEVQRAFRERQEIVPVHVYAAQDTWTAGPLTLRFRVER